jgi:GTP-binding protein
MLTSQFLKSAKLPQDFPPPLRPEIALLGRSNAGKSSFLNAMTGQKIAKVSSAPGKTRLLNFFDLGLHYRLVDMPGYGFASRGAEERDSWGKMIEGYVQRRDNLVGALLVMDIRRDWSSDESMIASWLHKRGLPLCVALNKSDKLTARELKPRVQSLQSQIKEQPTPQMFAVSSLTKIGVEDVEDYMYRAWIKQ